MGNSIKRKFLVHAGDWRYTPGVAIRQGLIVHAPERTAWVYVIGNQGFLTIARVPSNSPSCIYEYSIPIEDAERLLEEICPKPWIEKMRYQTEQAGNLWQIDQYLGENDGLILAEVTITDAEEKLARPEWLGREITDNMVYSDGYLAYQPYKYWGEESVDSREAAWHEESHEIADPFETFARRGMDEPVEEANQQSEDSETETRHIWSEIELHDPDQPLQLKFIYTLAFYISLEPGTKTVVLDESRAFADGETSIDLMVYVASKDFKVHTISPEIIRLPRSGPSHNKACFNIEPLHQGEGRLTALFFKNNNFIQDITLTLRVGQPGAAIIEATSQGRAPEIAFSMQPRDVSFHIVKKADGFDLMLVSGVAATATLGFTVDELEKMIGRVRETLHTIVHMSWQDEQQRLSKIYQAGVYKDGILTSKNIPATASQNALRQLAKAGWELFSDLFYGERANEQTELLGDRLCELGQSNALKIQILSQEFLLPWSVLYLKDPSEQSEIDPELFLGFRHIIEHIPLQQKMIAISAQIDSRPQLQICAAINHDISYRIDGEPVNVSIDQKGFWGKINKENTIGATIFETDKEILNALRTKDSADKILYFFCHARKSSEIVGNTDDRAPVTAESTDPEEQYLELSGSGRITLRCLKNEAPIRQKFTAAPLVILNACESAELSPRFYQGFMQYFTAKGARGMIGTECEMPILFAAEWAKRFFPRFLAGQQTVGEIMLALRREFYEEQCNLLGLFYTLYCDADTKVAPGIILNEEETR